MIITALYQKDYFSKFLLLKLQKSHFAMTIYSL